MRALLSFCLLAIALTNSCATSGDETFLPEGLRCEYRTNPLGIERRHPRLSWLMDSDRRDQKQAGYRILVAGSQENLKKGVGDLWDSGRVHSDRSIQVEYEGSPLRSGMRCWWKVRLWNQDGETSDWSESAFWEMGLLESEEWKANWISYDSKSAPLLRKDFFLEKAVVDARVYLSGLGYYELTINGTKIGDQVLDPGQTDYEQRVFYVVHDVTENMRLGQNALGVMLGNGWYHQTAVNHGKYGWKDVVYGEPLVILQLHLLHADGSETFIVSDETWKGSGGPLTSNNIYAGETYDARLEKVGWDHPGYDDSYWEKVVAVPGPGGKLVSQKLPPIKRMRRLEPIAVSNPKPGVFVYDMGQNFAGWVKLTVQGQRGTAVRLRFAEWLNEDGTIDAASTGIYATGVVQTDEYICKGEGIEVWEPRFTYHGFQYVEMTGYPGKASLKSLEGVAVYTAVEDVGNFDCSDEMIDRIHQTAWWTQVSNFHSVPTDCPHRERCGWLGDAFLTSEMTIWNFDVATFWTKFIRDIETSSKGGVPSNIAPGRRSGGSDPDWGAACIQLPWNMYLYYGDESILREQYEGMRAFMDHLESTSEDFVLSKGIGSLFPPGRITPLDTPVEFTSTVMFHFCADTMSTIARVIGHPQDAAVYDQLADKIRTAFNERFYDSRGKTYGVQEKNTLALAFELVPENDKPAVAENLNRSLRESNGHVSVGIIGNRYIYPVLAEYGYDDSVMEVLGQRDFPSFGYLFARGATTFWENWGEKGFEDRSGRGDARSKNHPFRGGMDAWMYLGIAGINPDPDTPAFKHVILRPQLVEDLDFARAQYRSIHGRIVSAWRKKTDAFEWMIRIPANTSATVFVPAGSEGAVTESDLPATESEGVDFLRMEGGRAVFRVGSGDYLFRVG